MMTRDGITQEQFAELRREAQESKWLAHVVLQQLVGKEKADRALEYVRGFIEDHERWERFGDGTPVYRFAGAKFDCLIEADLYTLEEVAARPRAEVAAVRGVGPVTLGRLEAAMSESGLSWGEAA